MTTLGKFRRSFLPSKASLTFSGQFLKALKSYNSETRGARSILTADLECLFQLILAKKVEDFCQGRSKCLVGEMVNWHPGRGNGWLGNWYNFTTGRSIGNRSNGRRGNLDRGISTAPILPHFGQKVSRLKVKLLTYLHITQLFSTLTQKFLYLINSQMSIFFLSIYFSNQTLQISLVKNVCLQHFFRQKQVA